MENKTIVISHNTSRYLLMHYKQLLESLVARYDKVICLTPSDGHERQFGELGATHIPLQIEQHGMNPFKEWRVVAQFKKVYQQYRPEVAFHFSIKPCLYGTIAARLAAVPKIANMVTGLGYVFLGQGLFVRGLQVAVSLVYRSLMRAQDVFFFQNPDDARLFADLKMSSSCAAQVLNGTGIDLQEFVASAPVVENRVVRFLFIGRLLKDKGLYELAQACQQLKQVGHEFECHVLGARDSNPSAVQEQELEQWQASELLYYHGEVSDVKPFIEQADVFVLPSYREGLPRAGLEAMAMSRAVIATDVPGCRELVKQGNGFLIKAKDAMALMQAMQKFIQQPQLCGTMGQVSRCVCEKEFAVEQVVRVINKAL